MARPKKEGTLDKAIMVRVDPGVYERLVRIAKVDERTVAMTVRRAIDRGLPLLEEDVAQQSGSEVMQ